MAEIKSTLEMVMERAAAMGRASHEEMEAEEQLKKGMRLGAEYLQGDSVSLVEKMPVVGLDSQLRKGVAQALLRNIMLPRNEKTQVSEKAMAGMMELSGGAGDIGAVLSELHAIISRYVEHRAQVRQQLEAGVRQQMEHAAAQQPGQPGGARRFDPEMHPKFREEWQRILAEMNSQYGEAVEQHKAVLAQRLGCE